METELTTLALNIIVGPNEAFELNRCLESVCVEGLFDEIVIVTTSHDEEVKKVAEKFTSKVFYLKWCDDFAAARNEALKHTTTKHMMWLDADDVIEEPSRSRLLRMKEFISKDNHDTFLVSYNLVYNEVGEVTQFMPKDRVFKLYKNLQWKYRIHEQVEIKNKDRNVAAFNGISVEHRPTKDGEVGVLRNLKILEEEYNKDISNKHYAFFYARDLMITDQMDKALMIFDSLVRKRTGTQDNLFACSLNIATHYTYKEEGLKEETLDMGETYSRIALSFSERYAEPYVILGDIYHYKGMVNEAIDFYKTAMSKHLDGFGLQQTEFYEKLPADRLSRIYEEDDSFTALEQALFYNKLALQHAQKDEVLLANRKRILQKINEGG